MRSDVPRRRSQATLLTAAVLTIAPTVACGGERSPPRAETAGAALAALPSGWPSTLPLGIANGLGEGRQLSGYGRLRLRYQYLSGGANTDRGWTTWHEGDGSYVTAYLEESRRLDVLATFSYYQLLQSRSDTPASTAAVREDRRERARIQANLGDPETMRAYLRDAKRFFELAGAAAPQRVVLHVEPDLWGYTQQLARDDDATTVSARVASTGLPELTGLPDDVSGLARAFVRLRDRYAPNVQLAYALSTFGTDKDLRLSRPDAQETLRLARRGAAFLRSLRARFDLAFAEFANRDDGYARTVLGDGGASRWNRADFKRHADYLAEFSRLGRLRIVLWQIALGNTVMRALDNTPGHYEDSKVQELLGAEAQRQRSAYVRAGVIGLLFGGALPTATCACDARRDGTTNPPVRGSGRRRSLNADDDGGYFRARARAVTRAPAQLPLGTRRGRATRHQEVDTDEGERGEEDEGEQHGHGNPPVSRSELLVSRRATPAGRRPTPHSGRMFERRG